MTTTIPSYAGIGSRETPDDVLLLMEQLGYALAEGFNLRSGAADGADAAFAKGAQEAGGGIELYLPWPSFNNFDYKNEDDQAVVKMWEPGPGADKVAERFHPAWANLKQGAKKLHARNTHQIVGPEVGSPDLSKFVICWTPEGKGGGGTGQALRIATFYKVPIFDLAILKNVDRMTRWLDKGGLRV